MDKKEKITVQNTRLLACWNVVMGLIFTITGKGKPHSAWRKVGKMAAWCSRHDIPISELTTEITEDFYQWLMNGSGLMHARRLYNQIRKSWEDMAALGKVPTVTFYRPPHMWSKFGIRQEDLPPNLRNPLEDLANRSRDGKGENVSLRNGETSLQNRLEKCRRFLGFVKNEMGEDLKALSLEQLFGCKKYIQAFHKFKVDRKDGKVMVGHLDELKNLVWMGERYISKYCAPVNMGWLRLYIKRVRRRARRRDDYGAYIEESEVQKVLQKMGDRLEHATQKGFSAEHRLPLARDLFAIQFFLDHGNRVSSLTNSKMGDQISPDKHGFRCSFRTKNQAEDRFRMSVPSVSALKGFYGVREEMGIENAYVMVTRKGNQLGKEQLHDQVLGRFRNILKIPFSTQWFRYTFITGEIKRHGDPALAALRMGNQSAVTASKHYDRLAPEQVAPEWHEILEAELRGGEEGLLHWAKLLLQRAAQDAKLAKLIRHEIRKYKEGGERYEMSYAG